MQDEGRYLLDRRYNWRLVWCPYDFPEVRWSVCLEPMSAPGGTKKWSWELSLVTAWMSVRTEKNADGRTHSQSENVIDIERPSTKFLCSARFGHCLEDGRA